MRNKTYKKIVGKLEEKHYQKYLAIHRKKRRKTKGQWLFFLIVENILIWSFVWSIVDQPSNPIIYHSPYPVVQTVEASLPDPCGLEVVDCDSSESFGDSSEAIEGVSPITVQIEKEFGKDAPIAIAIAKAESGLNPNTESWTDRMKDGRPFSVGLFQVNLTYSEVAGVNCTKAFEGKNYHARIIDEGLYKKCVDLAKDPYNSILVAKKKYENRGNTFDAWGAYLNKSYLKFL